MSPECVTKQEWCAGQVGRAHPEKAKASIIGLKDTCIPDFVMKTRVWCFRLPDSQFLLLIPANDPFKPVYSKISKHDSVVEIL